ncbi:MAG: hypothetical protein Q9164_003545 [Protoblastenia rupestris]
MDNAHGQKPGNSLFGGSTIGEVGSIELKKGQDYCIRVKPALSQGGQIRRRRPPYWLRETLGHRTSNSRYGNLVSEVDQVAVFAGLNGEWKGESFDRPNMDLSENNIELIRNLETTQKDEMTNVAVFVENTGKRSGAEVFQIYIPQNKPGIERPVKEFKGFKEVFFEPAKKKVVELEMELKYAASL